MISRECVVYGCARTHKNKHHSAPGIRWANFHMRIILSGHGWYYHNQERIDLSAGHILLLGPDAGGHVVCDPKDPYDFYFINYNGELAAQLSAGIEQQCGIYFKHPAHKKILSLAQRISALAYLAGRQY
ncbi:MAG: AraC family ligand binding domain-containing protein [Planctomycetes bacterium]|nr:AraC family ligand binding domain-containing protein [Planctomycetota bacterium]